MIKNILPVATALIVSSAMFAATATVPAQAATSREVAYTDLDLSSPKDQARLATRLRIAAKDVCGVANPLDRSSLSRTRKCYRETTAAAQRKAEAVIAASRASNGERFAQRD